MQTLPWTVALSVLALLVIAFAVWAMKSRQPQRIEPLPTEWALSARPVFSTEERRVYKLLREALPHHIVLSKLPLVRFCQPTDPDETRYWYELLGANHVSFAVCSANGRVLAAIDLDTERGNSRRAVQIKQSVLGACRVRYLRCPVDNLPSVAELQLLVPHGNTPTRGPQPAPAPSPLHQARDSLSTTVASKRAERTALWQDSSFFHDSFFGPDNRLDGSGGSDFGTLTSPATAKARPSSPSRAASSSDSSDDDIGGVVVDSPRFSTASRF
jgi:Protein of unknown function (DUF2726)